MSETQSPEVGGRTLPAAVSNAARSRRVRLLWRLLLVLAVVGFVLAAWHILTPVPYRIDLDVYRQGARQWLDGQPLYGAVRFTTWVPDDPLPFTYPPLAAILFSPFAWMSMSAASTAITVTTLLLYLVSMAVVLNAVGIGSASSTIPGPDWLNRVGIAAGIVAVATMSFEPLRSSFEYGQINVVLMTLVVLDCLPRRTLWPRGMLVGLAIAIKLTPAIFLLYFVARRDRRAVLTALASFAGATFFAFVLAGRDSWQYWTQTVQNTGRIGDPSLNTNQNLAGLMARAHLHGTTHLVLWAAGCVALLALTWWAVRRVLLAGDCALALVCVALFGLLVSPVSWSHHWVWCLPALIVTAVVGYRRRNPWLLLATASGAWLFWWKPWKVLRTDSGLTDQVIGGSYVFWAAAVIIIAGLTVTARSCLSNDPLGTATAVGSA